jgi:2-polyprenyl-3-methyl-5-hydroxy-6-metoxy-1,4-benzoquinol methylase
MQICQCSNSYYKKIAIIKKKPKLEINYDIKNYSRTLLQCSVCKHVVNRHKNNLNKLYYGKYVKNTYGSIKDIKRNFNRIISLPSNTSDNKHRVKRIINLLDLKKGKKLISILDVGSGLGVFPYEMRKKGFPNIDCLEKDPLLINYIKNNLILNTYKNINQIKKKKYFLITLNKVLEHIKDTRKFLSIVIRNLRSNGFIYIEVPDYKAMRLGVKKREEFFIEHWHIFTEESLLKLALSLNLELFVMKRIREPSGKFSLFGIFKKN